MKIKSSVENIFRWNRRLHIYTGLFLLFFILLFSFSGLLLNHGNWKFASFWDERKETKTESHVDIPAITDSLSLIQHILKQLKISGEISNVSLSPESIYFRVSKPGLIQEINVDLKSCISSSKEIAFNWWGKIRTLHTFNGSDKAHPEIKPNWLITNIWRLVMDLVATGLIFLSISSWVMWYELRKSYPAGLPVLALGGAVAIFFIFILQIL
jgi:hypothetical protein